MFDKEVRITGIHAQYMVMLAGNFGETSAKIFNRNIDVYMQAPIVGFLYQRKSSKDQTVREKNEKIPDAHILKDQMIASKDNLTFNLQLILLLDEKYEPDAEKRIYKAFNELGKDEKDLELFESYLLGGIEVLYEKLIRGASSADEYIEKLASFTDDIQIMFNSKVDKEQILGLLS